MRLTRALSFIRFPRAVLKCFCCGPNSDPLDMLGPTPSASGNLALGAYDIRRNDMGQVFKLELSVQFGQCNSVRMIDNIEHRANVMNQHRARRLQQSVTCQHIHIARSESFLGTVPELVRIDADARPLAPRWRQRYCVQCACRLQATRAIVKLACSERFTAHTLGRERTGVMRANCEGLRQLSGCGEDFREHCIICTIQCAPMFLAGTSWSDLSMKPHQGLLAASGRQMASFHTQDTSLEFAREPRPTAIAH